MSEDDSVAAISSNHISTINNSSKDVHRTNRQTPLRARIRGLRGVEASNFRRLEEV